MSLYILTKVEIIRIHKTVLNILNKLCINWGTGETKRYNAGSYLVCNKSFISHISQHSLSTDEIILTKVFTFLSEPSTRAPSLCHQSGLIEINETGFGLGFFGCCFLTQ